MSIRKFGIRIWLAGAFLALAVILPLSAMYIGNLPGNTERKAAKVSRTVTDRMHLLDEYVDSALTADRRVRTSHSDVPPDMVIYRYIDDTLQSWSNQFPVRNDDIASRIVFPRLSKPRESIYSPLADVTPEVSFVNYGQKWYLVKSGSIGSRKVIAGLEIVDSMSDESPNGVNRKLGLGRNYAIVPLSESSGSAVIIDGKPVFKIVENHLWGENIKSSSRLFSPTVYADGQLFNSLGAVLIVSILIVLLICCTFAARKGIFRRILKARRCKRILGLYAACMFLMIAGVLAFIHVIFRSIILNSNISLELYRLNDLSLFSLLVYLTLISLLMTVPLLTQMLMPALKHLTGFRHNLFSAGSRTVTAIVFATYIVTTAGTLGFRKEQNRVNVWANRLSIERDISLELELRRVEDKIASDQLISTLSALKKSELTILNRIVESYMLRVSQDYDVTVELFPENERDKGVIAYFTEMVTRGSPSPRVPGSGTCGTPEGTVCTPAVSPTTTTGAG